MPRTLTPSRPVIVRCVPKPEACRSLGISDRSFERHWQDTFTDKRPKDVRGLGRGSRRMVFEDELAEACANGGGVLQAAKVAVLNFRRLMDRR